MRHFLLPVAFGLAISTVLALAPNDRSIVVAQSTGGPIGWACPRHPDDMSPRKGNCAFDGLPLEAVRLESEWTCPEHTAIAQDEPSTCPICKRQLVKVEITRYYTCPQSTLHELEPGNCADGEKRVEVKHRRGSAAK